MPTDLRSHHPDRPILLTIGKFDGVHIGHQHLLARMRRRAADIGADTAVMVLHPNPTAVLRPAAPVFYLTTLDERLDLLRAQDVNHVIVQEFTREFAQTSADDFIAHLVTHLRLAELWEGPDFALGRGRVGTLDYLRGLGGHHGFAVHEVAPFALLGEPVSTSRVRSLLAEGKVSEAAWLLGRPHSLSGPVVHGAKRGRLLGYPTANLDIAADLAVPAHGIYVVRCELRGEPLTGVASIGVRPTFDNGPRSVEVYLLDFAREIYGETLRVDFIAYLRGEQRFDSVTALIEQMGRDVAAGRAVLAATSPEQLLLT